MTSGSHCYAFGTNSNYQERQVLRNQQGALTCRAGSCSTHHSIRTFHHACTFRRPLVLGFELVSSLGGSLYLHLAQEGCGGRTAGRAKVDMPRSATLLAQPVIGAYPSGDPVNCTELLAQHFSRYSMGASLDRRDKSSNDVQPMRRPELDAVWIELTSDAPAQSYFLDAGSSASSLPMKLLLGARMTHRVYLFQPQVSQQLETCTSLARHTEVAAQSTIQIYPVVAGERDDTLLPSHQLQRSFDAFARDRSWFGPSDDRYQTMNGGYLRGSLADVAEVPVVQVLSISGTDASEISLILQGGIELLNRHFVRNVLVTLAIDTDRNTNEERQSLHGGMKVMEDAGYHEHKTVDWSSGANHQLTVWWKL